MHRFNLIARTLVTFILVGIYFLDDCRLSDVQRSIISGVVMADILTWVIYQIYLLPRNITHFSIGGFINIILIAIVFKITQANTTLPIEWFAIAVMVFLIAAAIKTGYYFLIETAFSDGVE